MNKNTEQPAQQPVSVTDELVNAYCNAWEQSFTEDNPYHKVRMTTEDRKHIVAGLEAALAQAPTEQEQPAQVAEPRKQQSAERVEPVAWIYKPHMELLWPDEIEVKDPSKHTGYKPVYTSPPASKSRSDVKPLTDEQIWKNDAIMSANSGYGATFETLREMVRAIEAAHGIKE